MKPNDKPHKKEDVYEDPKLFIVIGEESFSRPGLETAFMDYSNINTESTEYTEISTTKVQNIKTSEIVLRAGTIVAMDTVAVAPKLTLTSRCLCYFVTKTICVCNKMRPACNCVGHVSQRSSITTGCRCAPVH
ncbi:MAG: hypothetical protein FWG22_06390 [Prolixibacteraceae bacterium]|nr:hypothetical protein [Prolixibacteraceae bacterium]